jgi:N-acetyl-anhydromuramyl-L-alanine amidase AmpD/peptidoglycan/xylan/chitin deacetylase (PgdA/CDA1 family)
MKSYLSLLRYFTVIVAIGMISISSMVSCSGPTPSSPPPTEWNAGEILENPPTSTTTLPVETATPTGDSTSTTVQEIPKITETPLEATGDGVPYTPAKRIPILEYHHSEFKMADSQVIMTTAWFTEQMEWLDENGFSTLSAEELLGFVDGTITPPKQSVVLTFDVGTPEADNFKDTIIPTLREHDFQALFFVLINAITQDGSEDTLTWSDLREWQEEGIISVQSHGVYHPDYQLLNYNQMLWDAKTSFEIISSEMGEPPLIFAYPFDSVPEETQLVMEGAGYRIALAGHRLDRSVQAHDPDRYALPRYYPYSNDALYPILSDGYGWTFAELMDSAIGEFETDASPSQETAVPEITPIGEAHIPSTLDKLIRFCAHPGEDYLYELDEYASFPTDISPMAQAELENAVIVKPTCNYADPIIPEAIILHFTEGSYTATVNEFRESELSASVHYIIDRDGTITQMVPEFFGAHHVTCYGNREMCTRSCPICKDEEGNLTEPWTRSIGIEIVNAGRLRGEWGDFRNPDGTPFEGLIYEDYLASFSYRYWEDYTMEQIEALRVLVYDIMRRWDIDLDMVLGHSRIQLNKNDPGPALNLTWSRYGDPPRDPIFLPTPTSDPGEEPIDEE